MKMSGSDGFDVHDQNQINKLKIENSTLELVLQQPTNGSQQTVGRPTQRGKVTSDNAKTPSTTLPMSTAGIPTENTKYRGSEALHRPPSIGFHCGENLREEEDEEDYETVTVVNFHCSVSTPTDGQRLEFSCREPSCGVLVNNEQKAVKEEKDCAAVDPNFFDEGYTLAGKTGWQVWPGSRLLVESLTFPQSSFDGESLREMQNLLKNGARVLELGAGVGMVGSSLANYGAQVLMTDLSTLVDYSLLRNLEKNSGINNNNDEEMKCPIWLENFHAVPIGKGWAGAAAVDWTIPLHEQLMDSEQDIDLVVASDCVWLISMLDGLLGTVEQLFNAKKTRSPKLLMSFQRRDPKNGGESDMFTSVDRVLAEIKARNWCFECLSWCPVAYKGEEDKEVFVFLISPSN